MRFLISATLVLLILPGYAAGQDNGFHRHDPKSIPFNTLTGTLNVMPLYDALSGKEAKVLPPPEPKIEKVTFLVLDPPRTLKERVDYLLYGIKAHVQPEYDHYGYEIRRYMAGIMGPDVYKDPARMEAELLNIKKAEIILDAWQEVVFSDVRKIEKEIKEKNAGSQVRTIFKYNRGVAEAFFIEARNWMAQNKALLEYIKEKHGAYNFEYPYITFHNQPDMAGFIRIFSMREEARKYINSYVSFGQMIY